MTYPEYLRFIPYIKWCGVYLILFFLCAQGCIVRDLEFEGLRCGRQGECSPGRTCHLDNKGIPVCLLNPDGRPPYAPGQEPITDKQSDAGIAAEANPPETQPEIRREVVPETTPMHESIPDATPGDAPTCPLNCTSNADCAICQKRTSCEVIGATSFCTVPSLSCPPTCSSHQDCASCSQDRQLCMILQAGIGICLAGKKCQGRCKTDADCANCADAERTRCHPVLDEGVCFP